MSEQEQKELESLEAYSKYLKDLDTEQAYENQELINQWDQEIIV